MICLKCTGFIGRNLSLIPVAPSSRVDGHDNAYHGLARVIDDSPFDGTEPLVGFLREMRLIGLRRDPHRQQQDQGGHAALRTQCSFGGSLRMKEPDHMRFGQDLYLGLLAQI
jgi:hypothetical protein